MEFYFKLVLKFWLEKVSIRGEEKAKKEKGKKRRDCLVFGTKEKGFLFDGRSMHVSHCEMWNGYALFSSFHLNIE